MQANSTMQLDHAATPCKNITHVIIRQYGSEPNVPTSLKQTIRLRWRKQALPPYCRQGPTTPVLSVIRQAVTFDAREWRGGAFGRMKHQHKTCLRVALSKVSRLWSLPVSSSGRLIKGAKDNTHGARACVGTKRT